MGRLGITAAAIVCALVLSVNPTPAQADGAARAQTDDEFIASLARPSATVDRKQLARVFFGISATLDGGRNSVQVLQSRVDFADGAAGAAVGPLLDTRYREYSAQVSRMRGSVSELLDEPESLLLLHRVVANGQRACWQLDLHNRVAEAYGADLMAVLAPREACNRFRIIVFQPRIEALIYDGLVDQVYQREEIRILREELTDLEQLLADIREIDSAP